MKKLQRHASAVALIYLLGYCLVIAPGYLMSRIFAGVESASPSTALVAGLIAVLIAQMIIGALDNLSTLWLTERHYGQLLLDFVGKFNTSLSVHSMSNLLSVDMMQVSRDFALRAALAGQLACVACCCAVIFTLEPAVVPFALLPALVGAGLLLLGRRRAALAGDAQRTAEGQLRAIERLSLNGIDFMRSLPIASILLERLDIRFMIPDSRARLLALNVRVDYQSIQNFGSALSLGAAVAVMWFAGPQLVASQIVLVVSYMSILSLLASAVVDSMASLRVTSACRQRWANALRIPVPDGPLHFDLEGSDMFRFCGMHEFTRLTGTSVEAFENAARDFGLDLCQLNQLTVDGEGLSRGQNLLAYLAAIQAVMGSRDWTVSDQFGGLDAATALRVRSALGSRIYTDVAD